MKTKLKKWKKISSQVLFRNEYFELFDDLVKLPDGKKYHYYVNNPRGRAALVIPFDGRGNILVAREFRYPVKKIIYNSIGGSVDRGESPLQAAKRELSEETGYRAARWEFIGNVYANPSRSGTMFYLYAAFRLTEGKRKIDAAEMTENVWLPVRRFEGMIVNGEIIEPYLLAAYLKYSLKHRHYGRN
jgi:ADP-ribose pyrophosphatase